MRLLLFILVFSFSNLAFCFVDMENIDNFERDMLGNIYEKYLTGFIEHDVKYLNEWCANNYDMNIIFNKDNTYTSSHEKLKGKWKIEGNKIIINHQLDESDVELILKSKIRIILIVKNKGKEDQKIKFGRMIEEIKKEIELK